MEEQHTEKITGVRLAKFLAAAGIASRRNCEQLIIEGRVTVNGRPVTTPAHNVDPEHDQVSFEGRPVESLANGKRVYILLNKPSGYTCSAKDRHAEQLVYSLVPSRYGRLFSVGRLDRDSEGLLILTNDGDFAQKLTHPTQRVTKRYYVECRGQFTTRSRRMMLDGMYDNDEFLQALEVEQKSVQRGGCALEITLGDGRKREVRRLCKDVGLEVTLLRRVAVGHLELGTALPVGSWRMMTEDELQLATIPARISRRAVNADPAAAQPYWQHQREERNRRYGNDKRYDNERRARKRDDAPGADGTPARRPPRRQAAKQIPAVPMRWYDAPEPDAPAVDRSNPERGGRRNAPPRRDERRDERPRRDFRNDRPDRGVVGGRGSSRDSGFPQRRGVSPSRGHGEGGANGDAVRGARGGFGGKPFRQGDERRSSGSRRSPGSRRR